MIQTRGLTKRYGGFTAVDEIDLDVHPGEVYGFLGPNGAGKTTTLLMLAGMIRPSGGTIRIGGHDMEREPLNVKRITSFIPDRPYLYERLTAVEFLRFVGGLYRLTGSDCAWRTRELLDLFELTDWGGSLIENFSHGMKQRLVFAAALLSDPRLLIVDEPTVGLDPKGARLIKGVFKEMCHDRGATVFLSTHSMEVAEQLCDRISVIHRGQIVATGTLDQLREAAGLTQEHLEQVFLALTEPTPGESA